MPDVFLSYKRERRPAAEHLAGILRLYGYDVWFDYALVTGRDFGLQIDQRIRSSQVLLVLWCTRSVASRWVHEEVDLGHDLGTLLPTKIEPCELPVGHRRVHHFDLSTWDGSPRSSALDDLLVEIGNRVGRAPVPNFLGLKEYEAIWKRFGSPPLMSFALDESPQKMEDDVPRRSAPVEERQAIDTRELGILRDIWAELRTTENVDRLARFLQQVRGTPLDVVVEERISTLELAATSSKTAEWLRDARLVLEQVRLLYESMGWRQDSAAPDGACFVETLRRHVRSLPEITREVDPIRASNLLDDYLNAKIHHGQPIPDDYTIEAVFPFPGSRWGETLDRVAICRRAGVKSTEYVREGFGRIETGLLIEPEVEYRVSAA